MLEYIDRYMDTLIHCQSQAINKYNSYGLGPESESGAHFKCNTGPNDKNWYRIAISLEVFCWPYLFISTGLPIALHFKQMENIYRMYCEQRNEGKRQNKNERQRKSV